MRGLDDNILTHLVLMSSRADKTKLEDVAGVVVAVLLVWKCEN